MTGSRWERLAAAGGAVFAVLYAIGYALQGVAVGTSEDATRQEIVARYSDNGNELLALLGALLVGFALFFALPFLASLRAVLRRGEGEKAVFSTAAAAGGLMMAALFAVSSAVNVAAFSTYDVDAYEVDPDAILLLQSVSFYALGFGLVGGGVLAGATSIVGLKTRLFPKWLAIVGLVLAVLLMFGTFALFIFVPLPLLLLWVLVLSVLLLLSEQRPRTG